MTLQRLVLAAALSLGGCGPGADSPLLVTCDVRANASAEAHGQCQEWRGDKADKTNAEVDFDVLCTSTLGGAVLMGDCPASPLGRCTKRPSVAKRVIYTSYYAPDFDAASAAASCAASGGTFAAR